VEANTRARDTGGGSEERFGPDNAAERHVTLYNTKGKDKEKRRGPSGRAAEMEKREKREEEKRNAP